MQASSGQPQVARLHLRTRHKDAKWSGLGHAKTCAHHDALAYFALLRGMQAVPNRLGQSRAGVKKHPDFAEQIAPQHIVGVHGVGDGFQTCGDIEIHRGRNLAQVAQSLTHERWNGFTVVDIKRATMVKREAHIVVATKGMVPRQPIHQHRRFLSQHRHGLQHLLLVGAPHAVRVDHALGHIGRTRGE